MLPVLGATRSPLDSVHRPARSRWHGYCSTPPRSCSSQALPPWRTCTRISPLPTSSCRSTRSTNSTGSALADVGGDSMSVNCPLWHLENVAAGGSLDLAARSREEASHVLQHIDLAHPQSSRRLR